MKFLHYYLLKVIRYDYQKILKSYPYPSSFLGKNKFQVYKHKCRKCGLLLKSDEPQIANWKKVIFIGGLAVLCIFIIFVVFYYVIRYVRIFFGLLKLMDDDDD